MQHTTTKLIKPPKDCDPTCIDDKSGDLRNVSDKLTWATKQDTVDGTNTLGLIVFAIVLGTALAQLGDKGQPLLQFFTSLADAMLRITTWIIYLSPIGVFSLVAGQVLGTSSFMKVLSSLGLYFVTVMIGNYVLTNYWQSSQLFRTCYTWRPHSTCHLPSCDEKVSSYVYRKYGQCTKYGVRNCLKRCDPAADHGMFGDQKRGRSAYIQVRPSHWSYSQHGWWCNLAVRSGHLHLSGIIYT